MDKMPLKKDEKPVSVGKEGDFVELESSHFGEDHKVTVKIDTLKDFADVDRVLNLLRDGKIIFLKIKGLRESDINELKRSVDKLRKTCLAMNGDMVGLDEDFLIVTPSYARVHRERSI